MKAAVKSQRRKTEIPNTGIVLPHGDNEREGVVSSRLYDRRRSDVGVSAVHHDQDTYTSRVSEREGEEREIMFPSQGLSEQSRVSSGAITAMIRASPIPKVWKRKKEVKDMGRSEKKNLVRSACGVIQESNCQLMKACW